MASDLLPTPDTSFRSLPDPAVAAYYRAQGWWGEATVAGFVDQWAMTRPGSPAIIGAGDAYTWGQYARDSDGLARVLIAAGLQPGQRVAVVLPDGPLVHTAYVAAEKAGLTVIGMGARAGYLEVVHLVRATQAVALVSQHSIFDRDMRVEFARLRAEEGCTLATHIVLPDFTASGLAEVVVDGSALTAPAEPRFFAGRRMGPDDLFMINSTSGTTGVPKCVLQTQNRWMYFHQQAVRNGALSGHDVFLSAVSAPYGFGLWTSHVTPAVLAAPVVLMSRYSTTAMADLIERHRVTVLCCVSTQFLMLLGLPDLDRRDLSSLRVMFTGGEAVPPGPAREFERRTGATVLQFFGSNETGLLSGTRLDDTEEKRLTTAGRAVPEMRIRLFEGDEDVTARGVGQPGCHGPATCQGYLDTGDGAARSLFTRDGWMLMGDVCEIDADGYIRVVGRASDFIIRGGKNVSATAVEELVTRHPAVELAAAVALPDATFGERVCVYVQLHPGSALGLEELAAHCRALGASSELIPEELVVVAELPLSSGGKISKAALRQPLLEH